jgi:hypothetical protein
MEKNINVRFIFILEPCSKVDYNLLHDRWIIFFLRKEEWLVCMFVLLVMPESFHVTLCKY